ncbi:MAG TPA: nucleotidyltransferase family protein [Croceibacterium sp.]|nr:nucleotidyltransferase family protein [Croceibacterium sp.]
MNLPAALVLAGSRGEEEPVSRLEGVAHKALARIGNVAMLEMVVSVLKSAGCERILVSADDPQVIALAEEIGAEVVLPGAGPSESVTHAFALAGAPMLVTTCDHPLLSPRWIRDFVAAVPERADVAVMLAERRRVEAAVPNTRRTWLRLSDGDWSGCNLFLLSNANARRAIDHWRMIESERKRPWRIAARLGWLTLFDYFRRRLSMAEAIRRVGARMGVSAILVPAKDGLAAVDVDKPDDLRLVRAIVAGKQLHDFPKKPGTAIPGSVPA